MLVGGAGKENIPRYCALARIGDARSRLQAEPSRRYGGAVGHARCLARALNANAQSHADSLT
ncbi:DUF6415 family natural product biosynthesis protein [Streptomyces sp. NPDC001340]